MPNFNKQLPEKTQTCTGRTCKIHDGRDLNLGSSDNCSKVHPTFEFSRRHFVAINATCSSLDELHSFDVAVHDRTRV